MKVLISLAVIGLLALTIWAEKPAETEISATTLAPSATNQGQCTFFCALKTLMFEESDFGKDFLKLLAIFDEESKLDTVFENCTQNSAKNDDSCEKFFDCVEAGFKNSNITFLFDLSAK